VDLRDLKCFLAVAEELHFGRAADRLHLAQPTVSEGVRRLERQLGGQLFDRSTRNVRLTELGRVFRDQAGEAYRRVEAAYAAGQQLAQRREGQFVVGSSIDDDDLLVTIVASLRRLRPDVTVVVEEMDPETQLDAVRQGRVDVGLAWTPPVEDGIGSTVVGSSGYAAVVPVSSPLARMEVVPLSRVATEPLITWSRATNPLVYDSFASAMDAAGLQWSLVATATGVANLASRVVSGQGIGAVPYTSIAYRVFRGLAYVPLGDGGPVLDCTVIWSKVAAPVLLSLFGKTVRSLWRDSRATEHAAAR
jgi:DNA-binding transcriptional LysR family regulator